MDEQWWTYLWACLENTCLAWKPKASFIACDATPSCGTSALTCDNSKAWLKRASNPRCRSLPVTSSGGMGLRYLGTYQRRPQRMDKEAKCKHCCLWPHQQARSMVTQHLPAMTWKNGRRGKLHMLLPGCQHGGLCCHHEQRGLMAKQKLIHIFGPITPLHIPPHPLAFLCCHGALRGSERLQHSSEWWWCPP